MKRFLLAFLLPFVLTATAAELTLTWQDNSSNEEGFLIERSGDGANFITIWQVGPDVETYIDGPLPGDTQYFYRVRAFNAAGNSGYSNIASAVTDTEILPSAPGGVGVKGKGRLTNVSTRAAVLSIGPVIVGFTVEEESVVVLVRAVGPTIGAPPYNVPGAISDPKIELTLLDGTPVLSNDNWSGQAIVDASATVGAFPLPAGSKDAALIANLEPGNYTAIITGVGGVTGQGLVEVYHVR